METEARRSRIDVWWTNDATGNLMLLFAYLLTRSDAWEGAALRVLAFRNEAPKEAQEEAVRKILSDARISADLVLAPAKDARSVIAESAESTLVFAPFRFRGNLIRLPVEAPVQDLLEKLPPVVMVLAAEDIDLDAEPEEGAAAELAAAGDLCEKTEQLAEKAEKEATETEKNAEVCEAKLQEAISQSEAGGDEERIETLTAERDKALEEAEKARRKAAKARVKADQAKESLEEATGVSESKSDEVDADSQSKK